MPAVSTFRGDQSLASDIGLYSKENIGAQPHRVLGKTRSTFHIRLAVNSGSAYKN
jgi:hypothetical protein